MLTITIDIGNSAFDDAPASEAARILRKLASDMERGDAIQDVTYLRDINGNRVGKAELR